MLVKGAPGGVSFIYMMGLPCWNVKAYTEFNDIDNKLVSGELCDD